MKYQVGDNVKIINYGYLIDYMEGERMLKGDLCKDVIGKIGIITEAKDNKGCHKYFIGGIICKNGGYNEDQLEMVNKNPGNE